MANPNDLNTQFDNAIAQSNVNPQSTSLNQDSADMMEKKRVEDLITANEQNPDSTGSQPRYKGMANDIVNYVGGMPSSFTPNPKKNAPEAYNKLNDLDTAYQQNLAGINASTISTPSGKAQLQRQALQDYTQQKQANALVPDVAYIGNTPIDRTKIDADQKAWKAYDIMQGKKPEDVQFTDYRDKPFPWGTVNPGTPGVEQRTKTYDLSNLEVKPTIQSETPIRSDVKPSAKKEDIDLSWLGNLGQGALGILQAVANSQGNTPERAPAYEYINKLNADKEAARLVAQRQDLDDAYRRSVLSQQAGTEGATNEYRQKLLEFDKEKAAKDENFRYYSANQSNATRLAEIANARANQGTRTGGSAADIVAAALK